MKKTIFTWLMLLGVVLAGKAQENFVGTWRGQLGLGGALKLNLVLHVTMDENGQYACTLDSPDQGAKGIAGQLKVVQPDSIEVSVPLIGASYTGRLKNDVIMGTFVQMGQKFSLDFERSAGAELRRPQTPMPPFPYKTEEVTFANEADGATLAGTLTYPTGYDPTRQETTPIILMVTGSGLQNRDEELFDHKPFLVIAHALACRGIATLRYDDRSKGKSVGGEVKNATTQHFMSDAAAGVDYLRHAGWERVGVLGHSEGANIAFMLAAREKADFIVSMAGIGVKGDTALTAQSNRILQLTGTAAQLTTAQYRQQVKQANSPWISYFINYDPAIDMAKTRCPVMAINGSKDCQVIADLNMEGISKALPAGTPRRLATYEGLNHLFQHCETGLPSEYSNIEETLSPQVLEDMAGWILSLP